MSCIWLALLFLQVLIHLLPALVDLQTELGQGISMILWSGKLAWVIQVIRVTLGQVLTVPGSVFPVMQVAESVILGPVQVMLGPEWIILSLVPEV